MVWISALVLTVLSYYIKDTYTIPVLASAAWIISGLSMIHVQIIGYDNMGNGHPYTMIASFELSKAGQLGTAVFFSLIGVVMALNTFGWLMNEVIEDEG